MVNRRKRKYPTSFTHKKSHGGRKVKKRGGFKRATRLLRPFPPAETWLQVFGWVPRPALGPSVAWTCSHFMEVAHVRLHEKCAVLPGNNERILCGLKLHSNKMIRENGYKRWRRIPECPLPQNIVGFHRISIRKASDHVLTFLGRLKPIFRDLNIQILYMPRFYYDPREQLALLEHVLPVCLEANIFSLNTELAYYYYLANPLGAAKFAPLLAQCQLLAVKVAEQTDQQNTREEYARNIGLLLQWLLAEPRADGAPKMAYIQFSADAEFHLIHALIGRMKEQFIAAKGPPSPSIVRIHKRGGPPISADQFGLLQQTFGVAEENARTGEQFVFFKNEPSNAGAEDFDVTMMRRQPRLKQQDQQKAANNANDDDKFMQILLKWNIDEPQNGRQILRLEDCYTLPFIIS